MSDKLDIATKAFNRGLSISFAGEREACRRACLRLIASELGVAFDPDKRIDASKEWGVRIIKYDIYINPIS